VELGKVDHLLETGANDVLVVRQPMAGDQPKERLIPWGDDVVTRVDLEQARIEVNWDPDF
jgi:16S rRNA processing protein RimM